MTLQFKFNASTQRYSTCSPTLLIRLFDKKLCPHLTAFLATFIVHVVDFWQHQEGCPLLTMTTKRDHCTSAAKGTTLLYCSLTLTTVRDVESQTESVLPR